MQSVCVCYNLFFSKVNLHLPPIYCLAAPTHRLTVGPLETRTQQSQETWEEY